MRTRYQRIPHLVIALVAAVVLPLVLVPAAPAAAGPAYFTLRNSLNHRCLETQNPTYNGQRANMWDCWGGWNQHWFWRGNEIVNRQTGKCLEILNIQVPRGGYGGVWDCWSGVNQRWSWGNPVLAGGREIRNHLNNLCLEIRDSYHPNGGYVSMWDCWGGAATSWYTVPA